MDDLKYKICQEINCLIKPSYNYICKKHGIYCTKHKKHQMIK